MSGGRAEDRDADLAETVGAARSIYTTDKRSARGIGYGGIDGNGGVKGREILGYERAEGGRMNIGTR